MMSGIILAAGASLRMGTPKALLKAGPKTFLCHIADMLVDAGVKDVIVVLGADAEKVRHSLPAFSGRVVVNDHWREGQLSSLLAGLDTAVRHSAEHIVVWPVDRPFVRRQTITSLIEASVTNPSSMVIPAYQHRRGHPVIFPKIFFDALRGAPPETGARSVARTYADSVLEIETDDEGILLNIDTPETYHRVIEKFFRTPAMDDPS